jgi:N-acyl-D-amino-acid deacylase
MTMLDMLIKNGTVVDGSGGAVFEADVGVADGRIARVAREIDQDARRAIDARGLCLAPGFIDPHTHSDLTLLFDPRAESKIRQGVTTEVIGNCGFSPAPVQGAAVDEVQAGATPYGIEVTWSSMGQYLDRLRHPGTAVNVVALVGHNVVRGSVLGYDDVQPTPTQQRAMEQLLAESLEQGARGMSTGLFYPPGFYAREEEVVALARVVARYDRIYASHIRSESDLVLESVAEVVNVARQAQVQTEIAHLKLSGIHNWAQVDRLMASLERAEAEGIRLGCDQYPYLASSTWLAAMLPYWAQSGGGKAVAQRLTDPQIRAQLQHDWEQNRIDWDNRSGVHTWDGIVVAECLPRPEAVGKSIAQIAAMDGKAPLAALFDLIVVSEGQADALWFDQSEDNVQKIMQHPMVVVGSDGSAMAPRGLLGERKVHPRNYGTFPRVLGRYVRQESVLTLEEAVEKMTSVTARRFGLDDRGLIREGAWADLVVFDAGTVIDRATFDDPARYPEGIPYVVVNGMLVIDGGEHTGALPGRVL